MRLRGLEIAQRPENVCALAVIIGLIDRVSGCGRAQSATLGPGPQGASTLEHAQDVVVLRRRIGRVGAECRQAQTLAQAWSAEMVGEPRSQQAWFYRGPIV